MLILSCVIILIGAVIMLICIIEIKTVLSLIPFTREPSKTWLKKSIIAHRALMIFFFLGYFEVTLALWFSLQFIGNFFVSIIFFTGAIFVYVGVKIQSKMTKEIIRTIEEIIPICSRCKKIRIEGMDPNDSKSWLSLEEYFSMKSDIKFTHGICPDCYNKLYSAENEKRQKY